MNLKGTCLNWKKIKRVPAVKRKQQYVRIFFLFASWSRKYVEFMLSGFPGLVTMLIYAWLHPIARMYSLTPLLIYSRSNWIKRWAYGFSSPLFVLANTLHGFRSQKSISSFVAVWIEVSYSYERFLRKWCGQANSLTVNFHIGIFRNWSLCAAIAVFELHKKELLKKTVSRIALYSPKAAPIKSSHTI